MRILVVSDLHYTLKQLDWVVLVAGEYDLVVVAGDLLDIASAVEPDAQIAVVLEYLSRIAAKTSVVACSGNHDLNAVNDLGERSAEWLVGAATAGVLVDGGRFETDQLLMTVCAWWDGPRTREVVDRQLAADALLVGDRRWIWAYHAPPDASPTSWTGARHYGDTDLVAWIEQYRPDAVLCGHVHQAPFATEGGWVDRIGTTLVLNPGRQPGPVPTCVELDLTSGRVRWQSAEGAEERAFAEV
ncbi:MAG TPA: metallophosphoesterase [Acidimicrobiia bacterium]|jgi:Icc-related predicted phosphoesterase|nr:metallophosphoesterase [Acidimicrobiia bacterium]